MDGVGHFVNYPDVVVFINADLGGDEEGVGILADFAGVLARAVELEEAGATVDEGPHGADGDGRVAGAGVDENVAFGVGGDAGDFTEQKIGGDLEGVRDGVELNFRGLGKACLRQDGEAGEEDRGEDFRGRGHLYSPCFGSRFTLWPPGLRV